MINIIVDVFFKMSHYFQKIYSETFTDEIVWYLRFALK